MRWPHDGPVCGVGCEIHERLESVMRGQKSARSWDYTRLWCLSHPGETAAIVTPQGTYEIVFTPKKEQLNGKEREG